MLYHTALTFHFIGIVMFAGASFMDFRISKQFWNAYLTNKIGLVPIATTIGKINKIAEIGGRFIVPSGILMIYLNQAWAAQPWFRIKMGILVIILINAGAFRRKLGKSLTVLALGNSLDMDGLKIKRKLERVQLIQLMLLTTMFVLSVFKFN
jgi:hypothetical protein